MSINLSLVPTTYWRTIKSKYRGRLTSTLIEYMLSAPYIGNMPKLTKDLLYTWIMNDLPMELTSLEFKRVRQQMDLLIRMQLPIHYADDILEKTARYARQMASTSDHSMDSSLFWTLTVCFDQFSSSNPNYAKDIQDMHALIGHLYQNPVYWFRTILMVWLRYTTRILSEKEVLETDFFIKNFVAENRYALTPDQIKEIFFIEYFRHLPYQRMKLFAADSFKYVDPDQVCPFQYRFSDPPLKIYAQEALNDQTLNNLRRDWNQTYENMETYKQSVMVPRDLLEDIPMVCYLFRHQSTYTQYGSLWNIPVGSPSFTRFEQQQIQMFVFQDSEGAFSRWAHELVHGLTIRWIGPRYHFHLIICFREGWDCDWDYPFYSLDDYLKNPCPNAPWSADTTRFFGPFASLENDMVLNYIQNVMLGYLRHIHKKKLIPFLTRAQELGHIHLRKTTTFLPKWQLDNGSIIPDWFIFFKFKSLKYLSKNKGILHALTRSRKYLEFYVRKVNSFFERK